MKISNAKIKNVTVEIDDRGRMSAKMTFEGENECCHWGFIMNDPIDVRRLIRLMDYIGIYEVYELEDKIIRVVESERFMRGFGHPIEDKFVPILTKEYVEISKDEFEEFLKK